MIGGTLTFCHACSQCLAPVISLLRLPNNGVVQQSSCQHGLHDCFTQYTYLSSTHIFPHLFVDRNAMHGLTMAVLVPMSESNEARHIIDVGSAEQLRGFWVPRLPGITNSVLNILGLMISVVPGASTSLIPIRI